MALFPRPSPPSRRAFVCFLPLALLALPAGAQEADELRLPTVTAHGQESSEPSQAQERDPSGFVSVVEPAPGEASTAAELVSSSPGVTVRDFGANQAATVSVRGSTSDQVVVLLDGLPLNSAGGGGADLSTLPAPFIERVSVARGAVGARYGAGALGGAVSLETRRPSPGEQRLFGELGYGSASTAQAFVGGSLGWDEGGSALVAAYTRQSEGGFAYSYDPQPQLEGNPLVTRFRENNASLRAGGLARLLLESPVDIDLLLEADGGRRGIPGTIQSPSPHAEQSDGRAMAIARIAGNVGGMPLELRLGGRYSQLAWTQDRAEPAEPQRESVFFADLGAQRLWGRHAIEAGLKVGDESLSGQFHGSHGRLLLSAFAGDEIALGPLSLLPALRAEAAGEAWGFSPKLGATLGLGEHLELKGNLGRSFRPPSFGELYLEQGVLAANAELKPETAVFADLGLASRGLPVTASVSGFYTLYDDLILYEYYPPMRARPYNFGKAEVYGAEAEAGGSVGPLALSAAYTLSFSANRSGDERFFDKELPYHPRHRLHARASYKWWRLATHADLDAQSLQQTNRTNTDPIAGRARADIGLSARLLDAPGLWLDAELRNLFDQQDQDLYGYPLAGRSFFLALRADAAFPPTGARHE